MLRGIASSLFALSLACSTGLAQSDITVHTFDDAGEVTGNWVHWWGSAGTTLEFDATRDADNDAGSGSLKVTVQFDFAAHGGDNQFSLRAALSGNGDLNGRVIDATQYERVELDLYWDTSSPQRPGGDLGAFEVGLVPTDFSQVMFPGFNVPVVEGWQRLTFNIDPTQANLDMIGGLVFKMWSGAGDSGQTGTAVFWLDNIRLIAAGGPPPPVPDIVVNAFDAEGEVTSNWVHWWGSASTTLEFDATRDADNDAGSGSLKVTVAFDLAAHGGDNQFSLRAALSGNGDLNGRVIDATRYEKLEFDLYWDVGSPQRPSGDLGGFDIGLVPTDFTQVWFPNFGVAIVDDWQRISLDIDPTQAKLDIIGGLVFKMWSGAGDWGQTGTATFWLDNVTLIAKEGPPLGAPTMSIDPDPTPGLNLFASNPGDQYQRQNIRTVDDSFSWVNAAEPVTYSLTIADYPDSEHSDFQTHIFLVAGLPGSESAPDWNQPNVVWLDIHNRADGTADATFRYKINQPDGNSMYFNSNPDNGPVGNLGSVDSATPLGTWSLTFTDRTNVVMRSPTAEVSLVFPEDALFYFDDFLRVYVGAQPNSFDNIGQRAAISRVQVTGVFPEIDDSFPDTTLDPFVWEVIAANAPGVVLVPPQARFWVNWTVPDSGFGLEAGSDLASPASWNALSLPAVQFGGLKRVLVLESDLPGTDQGYFRLLKP